MSDDWRTDLEPGHVGELLDATAAVADRALPDIDRDSFRLPTLGPVLQRVLDELVDGRGFALLRGVPVDGLVEGDLERLYWGMGTHLGIGIRQNDVGELLVHVRDQGLDFANPEVRGYQTAQRLDYHSDSSDVVGLLCVRPALEGGVSTIVSARAVFDEACRRRPDLVPVLTAPWWWDRRQRDLTTSFFQRPIFTVHGEQLVSYYGRAHIESACRGPQVPPLSERQVEALDLLDELANALALHMDFEPGDVQLLNNYTMWHARTAYVDDPAPRDLYRLWLTLRVDLDLPVDFQTGGIVDRTAAFSVTGSWEPVAFTDVWDRTVVGDGEPFLRFEGPAGEVATWTYGQFDALVGRCAGLLAAHDVGAGDAVHLALTNSPAFIAVWLATMRLGAWMVPSDPMEATPELAGHLRRTAPRVGFGSTARADVYLDATADALAVVLVDESDTALDAFGTDTVEAGGCRVPVRQRAAVMFTSGTTGQPKGVELTQANYAFTGMTMAAAAGLEAHHRQLVVLPLFHANAQFYSVASAIWAGASVALMHSFSASRFLAQAAAHEATHASLFAAPMRMILARAEPPATPVGLHHCWYAMNIGDDQHETLTSWFGCQPRQLYGMTETVPAVLTEPADDPVPSSMGRPTAGCLVDLDGDELLVGGEPGVTIFAGYLDDPATTEASFRTRPDGSRWFVTGDKATRRPDGRCEFAGRRSDVLKVAGENVSTVEVEQVLSAHPGVLEAAVVGAPDDVRDEVPVAFVVAADVVAPPSVEDLDAWCAQRLTTSKRPRHITLVDELPRTSVGKIRKFLLKERSA